MQELSYSLLNPAQERVIESVHRGFLYQHLYAAACLLGAGFSGDRAVIVEGDEDVELLRSASHAYIQIKTRSRDLIASDLHGALKRFDLLRQEHLSGRRNGTPIFYFIANQPPGRDLGLALESQDWPSDVVVIWPAKEGVAQQFDLPPAWHDVAEAAKWCIERAEKIPFRTTSSETLVWKLAATAMLAASGGAPFENHTFRTDNLSQLFEQLVVGLQDFPPPPDDYRPQINEPSIRSSLRVRMIVGFSGAGKTGWAAHAARHSDGLCIYYDVGDVPGSAVPVALAKEIAAYFSISVPKISLGEIILPAASGIESLRRLNSCATDHAIDPVIVIDNAHRLSFSILRSIVEIAPAMKFVMLCQPGGSVEETEVTLGILREELQGWNDDAVAATIANLGARGDPNAIKRLRIMTSGMPLYVGSAARVAISAYNSDVGLLCEAIDGQTHTTKTAQEIILSQVYDALPPAAAEAVAVLSCSDVGLSLDEVGIILHNALGWNERQTAQLIRSLRPQGILLPVGSEQYRIHEAFGVIGKLQFDLLAMDKRQASLQAFSGILLESLNKRRDVKRLSMLIRVSAASEDYSALVALAGEEMFHELGIDEDVWKILEEAVASKVMAPKQQFDALDGLVFHYLKVGRTFKVPVLLAEMEDLLKTGGLGNEDKMAFLAKRMQWQAEAGDIAGVSESLSSIDQIIPNDPIYKRILTYNKAQALWQLGEIPKAEAILRLLAVDYKNALGISDGEIFGRPTQDIRRIIRKNPDYQANTKRLADTLEFHAKTLGELGQNPILIRIQSMKFYEIVGAADSLIRVGMDVVDDHLSVGDPLGAKDFSEKFVMPVLDKLDLPTQKLFVRSQYAVVLSRCGEHAEAERILESLRPYYGGLDEEARNGALLNEQLVRQAKKIPRRKPRI